MSKDSLRKMKTVRFPSDYANLKNRHADPSLLPSWPELSQHRLISLVPLVPKDLALTHHYVEVENPNPTYELHTYYTLTYESARVKDTPIKVTKEFTTLADAMFYHKSMELSAATCFNLSPITTITKKIPFDPTTYMLVENSV